MSVLSTLARVGEGVGTGGLSEVYRAATSASQAPGLPGATQGPTGPAQQLTDPATGRPTGQWVGPNGQPLKQDPVTGNLSDPTTGNVYSSTGAAVVNPNAAQQIAGAAGTATAVLANLPQQQEAQRQALDAQRGQVGSLDATINGTAPSVAQNQLTTSLGQIDRNVESQAAGQGGQNAFAARRAAMQTIGANDIAAAQGAATTRAGEVATAQGLKANVLNAIAGNANTQTGQTLGAGKDFSDLALTGESDREKTQAGINTGNTAASSALKGQVLGSLGGIGTKLALGK